MIQIPEHVREVLGNHLALANTPSFLYRKFSESMTLQQIATAESAEAIFDALAASLSAIAASPEEVVNSYALLVALMRRSPTKAAAAAELPGFERLTFGRSLLAINGSSQIPTTYGVGNPIRHVGQLSTPASTLILPHR